MIRDRVAAQRTEGDRVEVWLHDGWWYGRVLEPAGPGGRLTVYFPGEGDCRTAPRKDCRTALTWEGAGADGGWFLSGTDEAVGLTGEEDKEEEEEDEDEDEEEEEINLNVDMCMVCGRAGSLICCDGCPNAYHMPCVGETRASLPNDDWYCPECVALPQVLRVGSGPVTLLGPFSWFLDFGFFGFLFVSLFPFPPTTPTLSSFSFPLCPRETHAAVRNPQRRRSIFLNSHEGYITRVKTPVDYRRLLREKNGHSQRPTGHFISFIFSTLFSYFTHHKALLMCG
jgi:hypothetical protein